MPMYIRFIRALSDIIQVPLPSAVSLKHPLHYVIVSTLSCCRCGRCSSFDVVWLACSLRSCYEVHFRRREFSAGWSTVLISVTYLILLTWGWIGSPETNKRQCQSFLNMLLVSYRPLYCQQPHGLCLTTHEDLCLQKFWPMLCLHFTKAASCSLWICLYKYYTKYTIIGKWNSSMFGSILKQMGNEKSDEICIITCRVAWLVCTL